jgi:hypothetical protein
LTFTQPILGSTPKQKDLYSQFIASKCPSQEGAEDELDMIPTNGEGMKCTGFHSDDDGVYLLNYQIKGNLKANGNIIKDGLKLKNLKSKINNYVHVFPRHVWLKEKVDGILERPLRADTPQGPRVALTASEYVSEGVIVTIELVLVPNKDITWEVIEQILDHGQYNGISQWRNAYYGTYEWERILP